MKNIPSSLASAQEILLLYRARWQIELLFKLWKSHACIDEWKTKKPEHLLCELYAKLLAVLIQHWILLLTCWDDPHRSWSLSAQLLSSHVPLLLHAFLGFSSLDRILRFLRRSLPHPSPPEKRAPARRISFAMRPTGA